MIGSGHYDRLGSGVIAAAEHRPADCNRETRLNAALGESSVDEEFSGFFKR
jgi:hypothetical protein